jgi:phage gp37-like protein
MRATEFITEKKKRRKKTRAAYSGPGGWYGYYYGHSGESEAGVDGGGGESVAEDLEQKYLWHGSKQPIEFLEPRQSVDTGGAAGSNQNAIYATSDPKVAIAMGLTTPGSDTGMFPNDPQMVLFSGKIRKGENVYLHKLPMNGPDGEPQFVQGGNSREFHSVPGVKGIKPLEIKAVPVDKYLNLIRRATPQDLELRKKYIKQSVAENFADESNVIFLSDTAAIVGQEHGKKLKLLPDEVEKIKGIANQHGAWYEGNGMDQELTKGIIDDYQGSWDDDLLSPAVKGYPAPFLYVLFSNIKENDTVKGKIGSDPDSSIFDRILNTQPSTNYFPDRTFDADTLEKFLRAVSEGPYDFVQMSQAPATEQNVAKFFKLGERLMWPDNWEEYPNRAGRVAKSVNDLRDKFLASRKRGVYVAGSDHLKAVQQFLDQTLSENFADGRVKGKSRPGRVKRAGASCKGSVTSLRQKAKKSGGERGRMYHWCANMKSGRQK